MPTGKERLAGISAVSLGMTAIITQVVVTRELMAVFRGNELSIGLVLGCWMLLTGLGAWSARWLKSPGTGHMVALLSLAGTLPALAAWGPEFLKLIFLPPGTDAGLWFLIGFVFLSLLPFCLTSGFLFPVLCGIIAPGSGVRRIHKIYALEGIGSIAGGLFFSLALVFLLDTGETLALLAGLNFIIASFALHHAGHDLKAALLALAGAVVVLSLIILGPGKLLERKSYAGQSIIGSKNTPHGKLLVTLASGQLNIYANGTALLSGSDPVFREESVHYAMLMHRKPEKILVISGGVEGTLSEVLKYGPQEIDYIEPDPWLIREAGYFSPLPSDSIIQWYFGDPRRFVHKAHKRWDVVIVNLSAPASAELNRFFSQEFFLAVRKKLNQGGIICLSLPAGGNYLGDASRELHSVTYQTLSSVFRSVRLVPGHRNYFLASDSALNRTFAEAFGAWPLLDNDYVNPDYVDDRLINLRSDAMLGSLDQTPAVNRDLRPLAFRLFVNFRLSQDRYKPWILPVLLFLGLMAFIIFLAPVRMGLFAGGMTGASAELLLLLTLQIGFGNIYWLTGLVFTAFMAGLAAGSWSLPGHTGKRAFKLFLGWQLSFLILALILAFTLPMLARPGMPGGIALTVIFSLVVFAGVATGRQFSLAGVLSPGSSVREAGENYASDSAGAAMGIMLVTVFILPVLGAVNTSLVLAGLNALVLTRLFFAVKIA